MIPANFDLYVKQRIGFALGSDLESIPKEPGVYAWFLPLNANANAGAAGLLASLTKSFDYSRTLSRVQVIAGPHELDIRHAPPLFQLSAEQLQECESRLDGRDLEHIATVLFTLSVLLRPIYVGMARGADGLHGRLRAHVSGGLNDAESRRTLNARLSKELREPAFLRRCIAMFIPLRVVDEKSSAASRLLEHALIRLLMPSASKRG